MLISEQYKAQVSQLHNEKADWGTTGRQFASLIQRLVQDYQPLNILDYGCGKQTLARALPQYRIKGYDPGVPGLGETPEPHELVVCTDVLEHVEPDCLEDVLDDLQRVTKSVLFIDVCTVPAIQEFPDGRNAHLIVETPRWWVNKLWDRFNMVNISTSANNTQGIFSAIDPKGNGTK